MTVLVTGLMGSGKTAVGTTLAALLGWPYLDNDRLVAAGRGAALAPLVQRSGEAALRSAESAALRAGLALGPQARVVVGVAAGVVLAAPDRQLLAAARAGGAQVIWLRARPETLAARVSGPGAPPRPWLAGDPVAALRGLAAVREPHLARLATIGLDTDGVPPIVLAARLRAAVSRQRPSSASNAPSSSRSLTVERNLAASAPSTTRWS